MKQNNKTQKILGVVAFLGLFAAVIFSGNSATINTADAHHSGIGQSIAALKVGQPSVNANSCNADDVCEMKDARVSSDLFVTDSIEADSIYLNDDVETDRLFSQQIETSELFSEDAEVENLRVESTVVISNLQGPGVAYACLDEEGRLFRSASPCGQYDEMFLELNVPVEKQYGGQTFEFEITGAQVSGGVESIILSVNGERETLEEGEFICMEELALYIPDMFVTNIPTFDASATIWVTGTCLEN